MLGQRPELEVQEFVDVQFPDLVLVVKAPVFPFVGSPVNNALLNQKAAPQVVAIPRYQGVVEIEQCYGHSPVSILIESPQSIHETVSQTARGMALAFAPGHRLWENDYQAGMGSGYFK
jgi:hypothetical protein